MATAKFYTQVDFSNQSIWYGQLTAYTANRITISDGALKAHYTGNFYYSSSAVFGTLNSYQVVVGPKVLADVSGIGVDAYRAFYAVQIAKNANTALSIVFSKADTMIGSGASDIVYGYGGADNISGGFGSDILKGNTGNDKLFGNDHADKLFGGAGSDTLHGGYGNDILKGEGGNDKLYGNNHADSLFGGDGADFLRGDKGTDTLNGGNGNDKLSGGEGNDSLFGNNGADKMFGHAGTDKLFGGGGNDLVNGGAGNDTLEGGIGRDTFVFGKGSGKDKVLDYVDNIDSLRLVGHTGGFGDLTIFNAYGNRIIEHDGGTVVLVGEAGLQLTPSDFEFV